MYGGGQSVDIRKSRERINRGNGLRVFMATSVIFICILNVTRNMRVCQRDYSILPRDCRKFVKFEQISAMKVVQGAKKRGRSRGALRKEVRLSYIRLPAKFIALGTVILCFA